MAKKRLTAKEASAKRTKKVRLLFKKNMATHLLVSTGNVTNEASWMRDVHRVGDCLRAAMRGDDSLEEVRIGLHRKYEYLAKQRSKD
tara:strand:+ start:237 stop:497 length:261 start_codon:yes stop_codon:yes gene_type:complete